MDAARSGSTSSNGRVLKRTQNACRRCKKRKVKCSGQHPCRNCQVGSHDCIFDEVDRRVAVSEKRFRDIQQKLSALEGRPDERLQTPLQNLNDNDELMLTSDQGTINALCDNQENSNNNNSDILLPEGSRTLRNLNQHQSLGLQRDLSTDSIVNPLTASPSQFAIDPSGSHRYLGHSSTWSFSWQVRNLINQHVHNLNLHDEVPGVEGAVYSISEVLDGTMEAPTPDIPPYEYVKYQLSTVQFHLGSIFHFFDAVDFMDRVQMSYKSGTNTQNTSGLWYTQLHLILAFGKLFTGRRATALGPPGAEYFIDAMRSLPSVFGLFKQPVLAVEVLCLVALYLQCIDMRNAAYTYIGQAMRICLSQGLNRSIALDLLPDQQYQHRLKLWWSVYILERKLSTLMGTPLALNAEEDINIPSPPEAQDIEKEESSRGLALNVKLSHLLGKVVTTVYRLNGRVDKSFLGGVQEVLIDMTDLIPQLNSMAPLRAADTCKTLSRSSASLHLSYHQCPILAIRPIAFYLTKRKLEMHNYNLANKELSDFIKALLGTCIEACVTSLNILISLHDQDLIEIFLPFDLEATFSSAFVITLIAIVDVSFMPALRHVNDAKVVLQTMSSLGNKLATCYLTGLNELQTMGSILHDQDAQRRSSETISLGESGSSFVDRTQAMMSTQVEDISEIEYGNMQSALEFFEGDLFDGMHFDVSDDQWFWADNQ